MLVQQNQLTTYFLDGVAVSSLSADMAFANSGFLFGESVFTTAGIQSGGVTFYQQHLKRLVEGWHWLFQEEIDADSLKKVITDSYQNLNSSEDLRIRISLFKDDHGDRHVLCGLSPWKFGDEVVENVNVVSGLPFRASKEEGIKTPDYIDAFRMRRLEKSEILLKKENGIIGESSVSNVVLFKKGEFLSPVLSRGILKGIALQYGLEGLNVHYQELHEDDLDGIEGAWLVNSLRGPQKIMAFNRQELVTSREADKKIRETFKINAEKYREEI